MVSRKEESDPTKNIWSSLYTSLSSIKGKLSFFAVYSSSFSSSPWSASPSPYLSIIASFIYAESLCVSSKAYFSAPIKYYRRTFLTLLGFYPFLSFLVGLLFSLNILLL